MTLILWDTNFPEFLWSPNCQSRVTIL